MAWNATLSSKGKPMLSLVTVLFLFFQTIAQNPVSIENALPGVPYSEWGVPDFRDNRIAGFSTKMTLNAGETVRFKINVQNGAAFTLKIYRIGYYAGNGARLIQNLGVVPGKIQPAGISDPVTGMLDCGNWTESAAWAIPPAAVSGLYIAKIERVGGGSNHIVFIVRNDSRNSDIYFQIPDATWQAYNGYGGNSLYDGNTAFPNGHAVKVSYNRPIFPYNSLFNTDGRQADWYMNAEYPMIRWLERNGYDVSYTGSNDIAVNGGRLLNHKVFISNGHDEYWSKEQRNNVEAARNAGVHLAFFSGNEVYWKTRWENHDGTEHRTLVCYKEGLLGDGSIGERVCEIKCDASSNEWTGLWRTGGNFDGGKPENGLTGQISWVEAPAEIGVPSFYKKLRFWRNTSIVNLPAGQTAFLGVNTLGYEWDYEQPQYASSYPSGRITMSSRTINNLTHKLSLYRHSSGALVFGAGTIQWSWGLDGAHLGGSTVISPEMQQATVNLLADMGVQPVTLQAGLVAATKSTDMAAPVSTITTPGGSKFVSGTSVTINGTATDGGGGVVAGVEVSVDGGLTWKPAELNVTDVSVTWSYTWTPRNEGNIVVKTRAFDDSGNMQVPGAGITLTITPAVCPCTVFIPSDVPAKPLENDGQAIELGMKFRVTANGYITGVRFYKGLGMTGTHTGSLWTKTGQLLARATFVNETASGWQQVLFSTPVAVTAATTYIVSYHSPSGDYAVTNPYFTQAVVNGPLRGLASGEDGPNGVSIYSANPAFPTNGFQSSNYWVDVVYDRTVPLVIKTHPESKTSCAGKTVVFAAEAIATPAPTVQWQSSVDGTNWTNISGATTTTLTITVANIDNNKKYRAVFSNASGQTPTNAATLTVIPIPPAPVVRVENSCGHTLLTASGYSGALLWSTGETTPSIKVLSQGTYSVTQTLNGCTSLAGSGLAVPKTLPVAPVIDVKNNCGNSILTAKGYTGVLKWSNGSTTPSITVTTGGNFTVTQTINGCTSAAATATASPLAKPNPPLVQVVNNCGTSTLTATNYMGSLLWNTGQTTPTINVSRAGNYTVTQNMNGCVSNAASATAAPKTSPPAPTITVVENCGTTELRASGYTGSLIWSTGQTSASIVVSTPGVYSVKQVVNGCSGPEAKATASIKTINLSVKSDFNSGKINAGHYIWFNSVIEANHAQWQRRTTPLVVYFTNSRISFRANGIQYSLPVPDGKVEYNPNIRSASTRFVNGSWQTSVAGDFKHDVFLAGLAYKVPANLPGKIEDVTWSGNFGISELSDTKFTWKWSAAVYSRFADHAALTVKPIDGKLLNLIFDNDDAGTPQNFKSFVVEGATGKGKNDYTGKESKKEKFYCRTGQTGDDDDDDDDDGDDGDDDDDDDGRGLLDRLGRVLKPALLLQKDASEKLTASVSPNPSSNHFNLSVHSKLAGPINVIVTNVFGQVVEKHEKVAAGITLRLGEGLHPGIYLATVIQGNQQRSMKIIKVK